MFSSASAFYADTTKTIQNQYFDTTVLNKKVSKNFVVWWDKRFNHDSMATDVIKWAEWEWDKCINQWGMTPPKGSNTLLINIYLHHRGVIGDGIDVFDDGWGQGVGTDKYGMPFLTEPMSKGADVINPYPWSGMAHELFHIMQYYGTNVDGTFTYNSNNRWYVEGAAEYFQSYYIASLFKGIANPYVNGVPAYLFNPQINLWHSDFQNDTISWSRAVHGYSTYILFDYLTWKNYIPEDFIGKSFASKSKLSPIEYLYQNIPNFTNAYRDFALKASVLDFPYFKPEINFWMQNWASTTAYPPASANLGDVNTYAFNLVDTSTNGFIRPKEKNQAWSYTATKIVSTKKANYRIQIKADSLGNAKTISNYYLGLVYQSAKKSNYQNVTSYVDNIDRPMYVGANTYSSINLLNGKCDTTISMPDSTIAYLVAVSTPKSFTGTEIFDYQINVQKSQYACLSPKPLFNTNKYSFCAGDSIKLSISNVNKGDSLKWFYGSKSDLTNVVNKTFTDSTKLFVIRTDSLGCVNSSDTISIVKNAIPKAPVLARDTANYLVANINGISWYKDGVALTDTAQKIKPIVGASYTAKTTQNGCTSSLSAPYYFIVTDIINLSADEFIKLAPNPFKNQLNFDFIIRGYQRLNMEVYDIASGAKVASKQNLTPGMPIYLGQLSAGAYVIKVTSSDLKISYQFKMVKL